MSFKIKFWNDVKNCSDLPNWSIGIVTEKTSRTFLCSDWHGGEILTRNTWKNAGQDAKRLYDVFNLKKLRRNLKIQIVEDIILKHKIKTETIVSIKKKTLKKGNNEIITQYLTSATVV
jgi:hypothetical protein